MKYLSNCGDTGRMFFPDAYFDLGGLCVRILESRKYFVLCYMAGFFAGILYANLASGDYIAATGILDDYFLEQYVQMEIDTVEFLWYVAYLRLLPAMLLFALGCTKIRKGAALSYIAWTGFSSGMILVTAVMKMGAKGIVKIKAKTTDGSNKTATCIVKVREPVEATGVTVADSEITIAKGRARQSGIVASPVNTTTKIRYYSDNKKVATVDKRGKIRSKRVGQATIYGETANHKRGYCDVLVVDLNRKGLKMRMYDTEQLRVNEISQGVTWYSKNINVATVDANGLVTGRKRGTTMA